MYIEILCCLRNAVTTKCPEKWRTNSGFHLHDNAPAHQSIFVKGFLAKNNVTTLEHPHALLTWLKLIFTYFLSTEGTAL